MLFNVNKPNQDNEPSIQWDSITEVTISRLPTKHKVDISYNEDEFKHGPRVKIPNLGGVQRGHGISVPILTSDRYYDYDDLYDNVAVNHVGQAEAYLPVITGFVVMNQKEFSTLVKSRDNDVKTQMLNSIKSKWDPFMDKYTKNGGTKIDKVQIRKDANKYAEDMNKKK